MAVRGDGHLYICVLPPALWVTILGNQYEKRRNYYVCKRIYNGSKTFWKLPVFYIYCVIFIAGIFGWIYFGKVDVSSRWQTIGAFLTFVAVYRGVFFNWMHADKTFRLTRATYFNGQNWTCKVIIGEKNISLYINGKINNKVEWKEILKFEEAKSYFKLSTNEQNEGVMIDKSSFTEGDADSFRQWMLDKHPDIAYGPVAPYLNK